MAFRPLKYRNRLLQALVPADLSAIEAHLRPARLELGQTLEASGKLIEQVYFLESGLVSVISAGQGHRTVEVGMIGFEGVTGHSAVLGDEYSPRDVFVQIPGQAFQIEARVLTSLVRERVEFHREMVGYLKTFTNQIAETSAASALAKIEARLARWLLMAADRIGGDDLPVTHGGIATALGVRRPSITDAIHRLEGLRLIKSMRAVATIRDRAGLEALASEFYSPEPHFKYAAHARLTTATRR